ncbi:MAG: ankyrin repeat protein [Francisellaceae bacterium]|nr:ankyrin repeat protein [Francisellaceae bacterium]
MNSLVFACYMGDLIQINSLLAQGVDATAQNNYAIRQAVYCGHLVVVIRFLEVPGVDVTARSNYAIRMANSNRFFCC